MTIWVLAKYGFNLSSLLGAAVDSGGEATANILNPGNQYGVSATSRLDFISLALALVLGTAGLPHVLMRFYTVPTAQEARRSVVWAIWLIGIFYLFTLVLGYGAAALVGRDHRRRPRCGELGGPTAGLRARWHDPARRHCGLAFDDPRGRRRAHITAATSFAHDIYANVMNREAELDERKQVRVARITAVVIGIVSIVGGIIALGQNIAFLVALAFAVAASANLPTILYSLFWKRFSTRGALWSMYGGLISCVVLIIFRRWCRESRTIRLRDAACRCWTASISPGSRWTTPASSRSRCPSSSAGWAP